MISRKSLIEQFHASHLNSTTANSLGSGIVINANRADYHPTFRETSVGIHGADATMPRYSTKIPALLIA
jgi:hypothetical protein